MCLASAATTSKRPGCNKWRAKKKVFGEGRHHLQEVRAQRLTRQDVFVGGRDQFQQVQAQKVTRKSVFVRGPDQLWGEQGLHSRARSGRAYSCGPCQVCSALQGEAFM